MDVLDVVKRIGEHPLHSHPWGDQLVQRINRVLPHGLRVDVRTVTGRDIEELIHTSEYDLKVILLKVDVSDIFFKQRTSDRDYFPKKHAVYYSSSMLAIALFLMVLYVNEADKNGYLPTDTYFIRMSRWVIHRVTQDTNSDKP